MLNSKTIVTLFTVIGLSLSNPAFSEDGRDWESKRAEIKAKFDTDGDGTLNETERQAARETFRKKRMERIDTDGDGTISDAEREVAKEQRRAKIKERMDTDGDGVISDAEKEAAKEKRRVTRRES